MPHSILNHPFRVFQQTSSQPQIGHILGPPVTFGAVAGFRTCVSRSLSSFFGYRDPHAWDGQLLLQRVGSCVVP